MAAPNKITVLFSAKSPNACFVLADGAKVVFAHGYSQAVVRVGLKSGLGRLLVRGKDFTVTEPDPDSIQITNNTGAELECEIMLRWVAHPLPRSVEIIDLTDGRLSVVNP